MRVKIIGKEWDIVNRLKGKKSTEAGEDWEINYATPIYGGWDLIVECKFSKLNDLDKMLPAVVIEDNDRYLLPG